MRERKSGTVIFIGSMAGWIAISNTGIYAASKHAVRGVSISLDDEITPLGLRSICIEPGYFRTSLLSGDNRNATVSPYHGKQAGDPVKAAGVIVDLGHGAGSFKGKKLPKVLVLGKDCYDVVKNESEKTLENLEEWKEVSQSTDHTRHVILVCLQFYPWLEVTGQRDPRVCPYDFEICQSAD
ncbi:hypothetical protein NP233_g12607 [Leucocoprinus birnbaumii]|uniref:Uncharacterized protein n=1 Tax=Leucocoprinus birnbaumii TaxID=56174 RepID=A0AAD5VEC3_9AGAR|nr:hypothetical protein NP233_g12607 [Leucocoprinus birnbaumii]